MTMKTLEKKTEKEVLTEFYFGIGIGITVISGCTLIILPFVVILIADKEVYK